MPAYQYEAAYASGEKVTGVVEALNQNDAVAQIRKSCEIVISIKEVKARTQDPFAGMKKINSKSLALVCRQFSIVLGAGFPLVQTVDLVAGQTQDKALAKMLRQVSEDISNGWSLSYSFSQRGARLPVTFRETIRAGEESGDLVRVFARMSSYYERMHKTKSKAASALMYPAFVLAVAVVVVSVIMVYAIPSFTATFEGMGIEMPAVTKAVIALSGFVRRYLWLLVALAAAAVFAVCLIGRTAAGENAYARIKLLLPVVGTINQMAGASQFSHTMSAMLAAGMPILQAIEVSGEAMTNRCMSREILNTMPGVESGHSLGECMSAAKDLPPMLVQMTMMGESTGSMESTLGILAEFYDNEVDTRTSRAIALIEPMIICLLAVIVMLVLLSVYLPIFSMYSNM